MFQGKYPALNSKSYPIMQGGRNENVREVDNFDRIVHLGRELRSHPDYDSGSPTPHHQTG
jgi:hypothetical protein